MKKLKFQGVSARVLYQAPSTAIAWSVFEFVKYYLNLLKPLNVENYETLAESAGFAAASLDQVWG